MKLIEAARQYGLSELAKTYKDQYGNSVDTMDIRKLAWMEVKSISINLPTQEATITVIIEK